MNILRVAFFVISFLITFICFGQNFNIGIVSGINSSTIRGFEYEDDYSSKPSLNLGFSLEYGLTNSLSTLIHLQYDVKAVDRTISFLDLSQGTYNDVTNTTKYNYLTIPLLIRYKIGKGNLKGFVNIGGFISFLQSVSYEGEELNMRNYEKQEFGLVGGVGLLYKLNNKLNITLEGRDSYGLTNISAIPVDYNDGEIKTNTISILLGFSINVK
ncbi:MAG: hypothetical protein Tsb0033_15960 [Winogradskyella sp.]